MTRVHIWTGRRLAAASLIAIGIAVLAGTALAGHLTHGVKSYTGCLTPGEGVLIKIKEGNAPSSACSGGQVQVHFSGGDITAISAGTGLTGGGEDGAVTLALAAGYRLPQACATGQVAKWSGTAWACANDSDSTYTAGTGLDLSNGGEFSIEESHRLPQACASGEAVARNTASGGGAATWACEQFASADQACSSGQFARGITAVGALSCAAPPTSSAGVSGNIAEVGNVPLAGETDVLTSSLAAGTYLLFASVEIFNVDNSSESSVRCSMPGWNTFKVHNLPPADAASLSMASLLQNHPGGNVTLECEEIDANVDVSHAALTAIKVG